MKSDTEKRNTNCLAGRQCTGCGSLGPFQIWTSAYINWTDDGTGDGHGFQFTEDAKARCMECNTAGTVQEILPRPNPITCDDPELGLLPELLSVSGVDRYLPDRIA